MTYLLYSTIRVQLYRQVSSYSCLISLQDHEKRVPICFFVLEVSNPLLNVRSLLIFFALIITIVLSMTCKIKSCHSGLNVKINKKFTGSISSTIYEHILIVPHHNHYRIERDT